MKKLYSVLKGGFALALALSFAGQAKAFPTASEVFGDSGNSDNPVQYLFTGTVSNIKADLPFDVKGEFVFGIYNNWGNPNVLNFVVPSTLTTNAFKGNYTEATGVLKLTTKYMQYETLYYGLSQTDEIPWNWNGNTDPVEWQVNADGSITIPDFEVVSFATLKDTPETIATFTNCKAVPYTGGSEGPGGGDEEGSDEGDIVGMWTITTSDPYIEKKGGNQSGTYEVTLKGNVVRFAQQTEYGEGEVFFATIDDQNQLTFSKQALSTTALYPLFQVPFNNGAASGVSLTQLNEESFTVQFDASQGTIDFNGTTGLRFGNFNKAGTELQNDWQVAFNFISAQRTGNITPEMKLESYPEIEIGTDNVTLTYDFTYKGFDPASVEEWSVTVNKKEAQEGDDDLITPVPGCTVTYNEEDGTLTVNIPNLVNGQYIFQIFVSAKISDDVSVAAKENDQTVTVGPDLQIIWPKAEVLGNSATYSAKVTALQGFADDTVFKMKFMNGTDPDADDYEEVYADATFDNGYVYGTLTDLAPGQYDYYFVVEAQTANGDVIFTSNRMTAPTVTISAQTIAISDVNYTIDDEDVITVTFNYEISGFEAEDVEEYEVEFFYYTPGTYTPNEVLATPELEEGSATVELGTLEPGSYSIEVTLKAYGADEALIATSNPATISLVLSGIEGINAENGDVRYFNLNGMEIARPEKGIVIRVQNGKTSKVVVK